MIPEILRKKEKERLAVRLSLGNPNDLVTAARIIKEGGVGAIGFKGIYGLFGNIDDIEISDRIIKIKNRPEDKKLIATIAPEYLLEHVDFSKTAYTHKQVIALQKELHALGVILPASNEAPSHVISDKDGQQTILNIWTEYQPLRALTEEIRSLGLRALIGTSANKNGQPTHFDTEEVYEDFKKDIDFVLEADYSNYPTKLRQSTSLVDLTGSSPRLHRLGSVSGDEIRKKLRELKFPDPIVDEEKIIKVVARK